EATGDEIDDEIREVFLEEFAEEIDNLDQLVPPWRAEPDNLERLRPIRRVFHTLKGSGRLVGARLLGEFSWKIENMLNRVLDGSRPATPAVIALVEQAQLALPQLHGALRGEGAVSVDLSAIERTADRVAAGEEARHAPGQPATTAGAPREVGGAVEAAGDDAIDQSDVPAEVEAGVQPADAPAEPAGTAAEAGGAAMSGGGGIPACVDPVLFEILDA